MMFCTVINYSTNLLRVIFGIFWDTPNPGIQKLQHISWQAIACQEISDRFVNDSTVVYSVFDTHKTLSGKAI